MAKDKTQPVPIRVDPELDAKINEAARLSGLSKADVMRLGMKIGFEHLRRIGYKVEGAVLDASINLETRMVAESMEPAPAASMERRSTKYPKPLRAVKSPAGDKKKANS